MGAWILKYHSACVCVCVSLYVCVRLCVYHFAKHNCCSTFYFALSALSCKMWSKYAATHKCSAHPPSAMPAPTTWRLLLFSQTIATQQQCSCCHSMKSCTVCLSVCLSVCPLDSSITAESDLG